MGVPLHGQPHGRPHQVIAACFRSRSETHPKAPLSGGVQHTPPPPPTYIHGPGEGRGGGSHPHCSPRVLHSSLREEGRGHRCTRLDALRAGTRLAVCVQYLLGRCGRCSLHLSLWLDARGVRSEAQAPERLRVGMAAGGGRHEAVPDGGRAAGRRQPRGATPPGRPRARTAPPASPTAATGA